MERRRLAAAKLKEDANAMVRVGDRSEALKLYEQGLRLLGLHPACGSAISATWGVVAPPDGDALPQAVTDAVVEATEADAAIKSAVEALGSEGRELLSVLASNAAQMYLDASCLDLGKAIERATAAIDANSANAKAYFRRATAAHDYANNLAKGADALLARAQQDVLRFQELDPEKKAAGLGLGERLARKRTRLQGVLFRDGKAARTSEPDWFREVHDKAIFVCVCGTSAIGRDPLNLPEQLLSMAMQARSKKIISVGVAYVGYKPAGELEMFDEVWQKKYYRMLRLGERPARVPEPTQVHVHGEAYNVWSLLEGRVRVMRVDETRRATGEPVDQDWMRYCAQLLWHGEPFVYQTCRAYMRFAPKWDMHLMNDLKAARERSTHKPILSWMSQTHEEEPWQWVSDSVGCDQKHIVPAATLAAADIDRDFGYIRFRRRDFAYHFGAPPVVAFFTPHNAFSSSDVLLEVPANPLAGNVAAHGRLTCENIRLHTHGWEVHCPRINLTWESSRESRLASRRLAGDEPMRDLSEEDQDRADVQRRRAELCVDPWGEEPVEPEDDFLDLPMPASCFWTCARAGEPEPWPTGREVGNRYRKGISRPMTSFQRVTGIDLERLEVSERARNAGLNSDRDFLDRKSVREAAEQPLFDLPELSSACS